MGDLGTMVNFLIWVDFGIMGDFWIMGDIVTNCNNK